jgi:hypothetical protein
MPTRLVKSVSAAAVFAACSMAMGVENAGISDLRGLYPGAQTLVEQGRVKTIYGVPMTPGANAHDAATRFLQMHADVFNAGLLNLTEDWSTTVMGGRFTVFSYTQSIGGVPVELGMARVLVLNGAVPRVVYAAGNLAPVPAAGLGVASVTPAVALGVAQGDKVGQTMASWGTPELVVFQGEVNWTAPVLTWKVSGQGAGEHTQNRKTFFVNAQTGAVVHIRDDVQYSDVNGTVAGWASPGVYPDAPYNPPALLNMPNMRVGIAGGNAAISNTSGQFTITNGGTAPVTVSSSIGLAGGFGGQWVNVVPVVGEALTATSGPVTPPGPANLVFNVSPSEHLTAQVNGAIGTTITHNYFKGLAPGFTGLDFALRCNTSLADTCNAFFDGGSINFFASGNGCVNTAFSTVISHEYGHFIVSRLGLSQGAFGEGYGDTNASMIWDDAITGRGFSGQGTAVRNPVGANIQVPCNAFCGGEVHCCGQQLPAAWWRILTNMRATYGQANGLAMTREMEVAWSLITDGGNGVDAIAARTAVEVLTVNDDDGNLLNGAPDYARICPAFAQGGVQCPVIPLLGFQYPQGRPEIVTSNVATTVHVNVVGISATPQTGTGTVSYRIDGGAYTTVPMTENSPNQYTATLPGVDCSHTVSYYFGAQTTAGVPVTDPASAPTSAYAATSGATFVANLDFESDPGWSVANTSVGTGAWGRGVPVPPSGSGAPDADFDGSGSCWLTDNRQGGEGSFDLDGGPTVLTTGAYDLTGFQSATVSYARYLESHNGNTDHLLFQLSADNGATWTTLESPGSSPNWTVRTFNVPNLTSQVRFRWSVSDNPNDSVTEAAVDAFKLLGVQCAAPCYANCDSSTSAPVLNVLDFNCFLNRFSAGDSYANCDGSQVAPVLNVLDFNCFLNRFTAGCP